MKVNLFTLQGSFYFYAVSSFKVGIEKPDMKKSPGAIKWFRAYRLNRKTLQFWVLRAALEVQCKLLITKHLSEGEKNQEERHDKNKHHKLTFQSKCMAHRNSFGSKLQEFVLILTLNSANVLRCQILISYNKEYYWKTLISYWEPKQYLIFFMKSN